MEYDEYVVDLNADCTCGCMEGDRFHKIYHFPNDYGASVVNNPKLNGFNDEGFRVMPLVFESFEDYSTVKLPIFGKNVVDCKSWEEAVEAMTQIKNLKKE
ncbi:MAG: hypothetical protein J6Y18_05525 [Candidatus Methanomethylophilaceae archaeon]|nr:hypothetical protein [Candidatus Methanomethylophilaceae archaeon]